MCHTRTRLVTKLFCYRDLQRFFGGGGSRRDDDNFQTEKYQSFPQFILLII
jgi:hypothetical protein